MSVTKSNPQWASGDAYEPYVGRWSRLVARKFLSWLNLSPDLRWLDVGCGTGALSQTILDAAAPGLLQGIDQSEHYVVELIAHAWAVRGNREECAYRCVRAAVQQLTGFE